MSAPNARVWPRGQLVSLTTAAGAVTFQDGHTQILTEPDSTRHAVGVIAGSEDTYDLYGNAPTPVEDPVWVYEWWLEAIEGSDIFTVRADLQTKYDAIKAACTGSTAGVSNRVGTLTVEHWAIGQAMARVRVLYVELVELHYSISRIRLHLLINAGYQASPEAKSKP